ncbi:MAG: alanine racemase [Rhizobiaceae bacterium]
MSTAPRLTINLASLASNWKYLNDKSGTAETSAVLKADAYGLGIGQVAPALFEAGCRTFFVAMVEEGIRVRTAAPECRIFVLNGIFRDNIDHAMAHNLLPVLSTIEQIALWTSEGQNQPCAIHVDTGMHRLGLSVNDAEKLAANNLIGPTMGAKTIMSHFACADDPEHEHNRLQLEKFWNIARLFSNLEKSLANSAAILSNPQSLYDLTRPGIAIYGGEAVNHVSNPMQPVVTAEARILQISTVKKGNKVGYGAEAVLDRETKIATVSGGYADGFHRASSGAGVPLREARPTGGHGWLDGHLIPVLGRVSMDLTAFDVTDVPEQVLEEAGYVELFGHNILLDDVAGACGTIAYELLTAMGNRYRREYIKS